MRRIVLAIPPLHVPDRFIDNPAFAFLPPLLWAAAAAEQADVRIINAMLSGSPLLRTGSGWLIGGEMDAYWSRLSKEPFDDLVIAWSSYHRRADPDGETLPVPDHPLFVEANQRASRIHLAEFWHAESRFEPLPRNVVIGEERPFTSRIFIDAVDELDKQLGLSAGKVDQPLDSPWLTAPMLNSLALATPVVRSGAADGAPEMTSSIAGLHWEGKFWPIMTSTGCSYRCLFCRKPGQASQWRARPITVIHRELDHLHRLGVRLVYVLDPIANYDATHFRDVLDALAERDMRAIFPNGLALAHLSDSLLGQLRRVSSELIVSVESGSTNSLATLRKPVDLEHAENILASASGLGFSISVHYIVDVPGETSADTSATLKLAVRLHDEYGVIPSIQQYVPPGRNDQGLFETPRLTLLDSSPVKAPKNSVASPVPLSNAILWARSTALSKDLAKLIINVSYACNNHCSFCAVDDRPRLHGILDEQLRLLRDGYTQGIRHLDIDGGEPSLYPGLATLLKTAVNLGYERINVTTNGRRLCYPDYAQELAQIRNLELCVSLHGPNAASHEALTRAAGSFNQTLTGLWNASRAGLAVTLNVTAVANNVHLIFETARLAVSAGAKRISVQRYTPFGTPDASFEPPIHLLIEQVALIRKELSSIPLSLVNFCACEAGPYVEFAVGDLAKSVRTMQFVDLREVSLAGYLAERRQHDEDCKHCHLFDICPGKWVPAPTEPETSDELVDFSPSLRCSLNCRFCAVPPGSETGELDTIAAVSMLKRLSPRRAAQVRFSGGEPTDRDDLQRLISKARDLGYREISIQTNGLRIANGNYLKELIQNGLSEVRISVFGSTNEAYALATDAPDGYDRVLRAVATSVSLLGGKVGIDMLATRPFLPTLARTVKQLSEMGVSDVMLWLPAYEGRAATSIGEQFVPTLKEVEQPLKQALAMANDLPNTRIRTIYVPLCILGAYHTHTFNLREENILIVNPGRIMPMKECAVDLGVFTSSCERCQLKPRCFGLRPSYLERHGDSELKPRVFPSDSP